MGTQTKNLINLIENVYEEICVECQNSLFYPPKKYQESCIHIRNASTILYNEAARIFNENKEYGKKSNLTINQIEKLLRKILEILQEPEIMPHKEKEIKNIFKEKNLKSENYLTSNLWDGEFIKRV